MSELGDNTPEDERPYFEPAGDGALIGGMEPLPNERELEFLGSPLLDTLRQRAADRHICYVHLLDSSELYGTIVLVSDDGRVGVIENGADEYTFDVSFVAVVQTPRNGAPKV